MFRLKVTVWLFSLYLITKEKLNNKKKRINVYYFISKVIQYMIVCYYIKLFRIMDVLYYTKSFNAFLCFYRNTFVILWLFYLINETITVINTLAYRLCMWDICVLALNGRDCFISLCFFILKKENGNELKYAHTAMYVT